MLGAALGPVKARSLVLLAGCVEGPEGKTLLPVSGPPGKAVSTDVKPRGGGANPTLLLCSQEVSCPRGQGTKLSLEEATGGLSSKWLGPAKVKGQQESTITFRRGWMKLLVELVNPS